MLIVIALSHKAPDMVGIMILSIFAVLILLFVLAGFLLFKRKRAGLYLGWILMPLILLAFPIGTGFGIFIITKIVKADVRALLT